MFTQIYNDFYNTIIEADRYKMLLDGLWVTIMISVLAITLGTLIGMLIALLKLRPASKTRRDILFNALTKIANVYIDIIRGTPVVVQLLILYMVVLVNTGIPKTGIAIIAFGINSGAYVSEIFRAGILAVDRGQMEAGRSSGLSFWATMRMIIIPQAVKNILPALGNEFIVLIKETAIVGYIAIVDITKAADFIISRTYKAFPPLITTAIIYFVITKLLSIGLVRLEGRLRKSDSH